MMFQRVLRSGFLGLTSTDQNVVSLLYYHLYLLVISDIIKTLLNVEYIIILFCPTQRNRFKTKLKVIRNLKNRMEKIKIGQRT